MRINLTSLASLAVFTIPVVIGFRVLPHEKALRPSLLLHSSTDSTNEVIDNAVLDEKVQQHLQAVENDLVDFFRTELGTNTHNPHELQTWIRPSELLGASFVGALGACLFTDDVWPVFFTAATANIIARQANIFGDFLRKVGGPTYFTFTGMWNELAGDNSTRTQQSLLTFDSYIHLVNNYRKVTIETLLSTMQNSSINLDTRMKNYRQLEAFLSTEKQLLAEAQAAEETQRLLLITQRAEFIKSLSNDLTKLSGSAQESLSVKVEQMLDGAETLAAQALRVGAGSVHDFMSILASTSNYTAVTLKDRYLQLAKEMHPDSQLTSGLDRVLANSLMANLTTALQNLKGRNTHFVRRTDYNSAVDQTTAAVVDAATVAVADSFSRGNNDSNNPQRHTVQHQAVATAVGMTTAVMTKAPPPPPRNIREALSRGISTDLRSLQQAQTANTNAHVSSPSFYTVMPSKKPLSPMYMTSLNKRKELKDVHARVADIIAANSNQKKTTTVSSHSYENEQSRHIASSSVVHYNNKHTSKQINELKPITPHATYAALARNIQPTTNSNKPTSYQSLSKEAGPKLSPEKFAERKSIDWTQVRQRGSDIHSMMQQQEQLSLLTAVHNTKAKSVVMHSKAYESYRNSQGTRLSMSTSQDSSTSREQEAGNDKHHNTHTKASLSPSDDSKEDAKENKSDEKKSMIGKAPSRLFSFLLGNGHVNNNDDESSHDNTSTPVTAHSEGVKYTINTDNLFHTPTSTANANEHVKKGRVQDKLIRVGDRYVYESEWNKTQQQQLESVLSAMKKE